MPCHSCGSSGDSYKGQFDKEFAENCELRAVILHMFADLPDAEKNKYDLVYEKVIKKQNKHRHDDKKNELNRLGTEKYYLEKTINEIEDRGGEHKKLDKDLEKINKLIEDVQASDPMKTKLY